MGRYRSTRAVVAGASAAALVTSWSMGIGPAGASNGSRVVHNEPQPFTVSSQVVDNPLADAIGHVHAVVNADGISVQLRVASVDAPRGTTFPAHVHVGPCTSDLAEAGGHYNSGGPVDDEHESWITFTVNGAGRGLGHDHDRFVIGEGNARSIVVHAADGARLGCLPLEL